MPLLFLEKSEPNYFPFQVVKSDDGGGNLVAYDSLNPTTGWTAPMASPFDGLWLRVEFSDYHVNFRHNGTTWVEYNKEAKIVLYSSTEKFTGLQDINGDDIFCKTFVFEDTDIGLISGIGNGYVTDISVITPKNIIGIDQQVKQSVSGVTLHYYTSGANILIAPAINNNVIIYRLDTSSPLEFNITIYYTKN